MDYRKNFSNVLHELRKNNSMSLQAVADIVGVTNQSISLLEQGKRSPSFEVLCALADYFDVSIDYLVGRNIQGSFRAWLASFQDVDTPMGDFAGDVCRCNDYPEEESYDRLLQYFEYKARFYNNPVVVDLFKTAWNFYKSLSYND